MEGTARDNSGAVSGSTKRDAMAIPCQRSRARPQRGGPPSDTHVLPPGARGTTMSDEAKAARKALQESMDLRDQGHTED